MPTDRLYQDIVGKLRTEKLQDATFERIAVRIANSYGVPVLPMPGGQDAGYDGAIVDADGGRLPGPLAATMQENGLANLRKNLRMHPDAYPEAAKTAFFVTTRPKTNRQKQNLIEQARKLGYTLLGIADECAVAEYLYYHPDCCHELLGFRGLPSALSSLPPRRRQHWDIDLVARDDSLDRLRHLAGDTMLVGIPGTGKTSLLSQASAENLGLFARTADRDRLAPDLRKYRPKAVFIDSLDDPFSTAQVLVSLREEAGIGFHIVVTGWDEDERIVELLGVGPDRRIRLDRLELDELVEVVRRAGMVGPRELIHNIVHQAGGSPGLAVTLTMACLDGNVAEVVTGEKLLRQVRTALRNLSVDERKAEMALAIIAVGGDAGMKADAVAKASDMHPLALRRLLEDIEAGGVIRPKGRGNVSVQPELLRSALVAMNFYGKYPSPIEPPLDAAPHRPEAVRTLILAAQNGREPPELRSLLTVRDPEVFKAYASLGPAQCRWVITDHREYLLAVSSIALHYIPNNALPLLIAAAKGDERPLHATPQYPLRIIHDWCQGARPGEGEVVPRREMTVKAALHYLDGTGDIDTAVSAFVQALTTIYSASYLDPGQGMTLTHQWTIIAPDEIEAVMNLWRRCLDSLRGRQDLPWRTLLDAARSIDSRRPFKDEKRVAESCAAVRRLRNTMVLDIFNLAGGHPGVAYEARQLTSESESWPAESEQERLYALLFGPIVSRDYREQQVEVAAQLTTLAEEWSRGNPDEAIDVLARLSAAVVEVRDRAVDRRPFLGYQLAERVEVLPWLQAVIQHNLDSAVVMPFLEKAILMNASGWGDAARSCIGTPSEAAAVKGVLIAGGPPELMADVVPLLPKYPKLVGEVCIRKEISPNILHVLLAHEDDRVASEAAIHLWQGAESQIDEAVKPLWRCATLRSNNEDFWTGEILSTDAALAFEWLKRHVEVGDWQTLMQDQLVRKAAESLTEDQRVELLITVAEPVSFDHLVRMLLGRSVEVLKQVLAVGGREPVCLVALERPKDNVWAEFIVAGHGHGISVNDLARASNSMSGCSRSESVELKERIEQVAPFLEDPREAVRRVARRMTELLVHDRESALANEHEERVWGLQ